MSTTNYNHNNNNHISSPTIHHLIQSRAKAISSIPYSQTTTTFVDLNSSYSPGPGTGQGYSSPLIPPHRGIGTDFTPSISSPSLYSKIGHSSPRIPLTQNQRMLLQTSKQLQVLSSESDQNLLFKTRQHQRQSEYIHADDQEYEEEEDEDDDPRRMSMVGGPKVRKYTQVPWEEEDDILEDDENQWSMISTSIHPNSNTNNNHNRINSNGSSGATIVGSADMFSGFSKHANKMINAVTTQNTMNSNLTFSSSKYTSNRTREQSTTSTILSNSDTSSLNNTRRGLAQILSTSSTTNTSNNTTTKHLLPSTSGLSLASNQTTSTSTSVDDKLGLPITPKLRSNAQVISLDSSPILNFTSSTSTKTKNDFKNPANYDEESVSIGLLPAVIPKTSSTTTYKKPIKASITPSENLTLTSNVNGHHQTFAANDRPLTSSGSPGFGLITLEAAQERERMKSQGQAQTQVKKSASYNTETSAPTSKSYSHSRSNTSTTMEQQQERPLTAFSIPPIPDEPPINHLIPTTSRNSTPSSPPSNISANGGNNKVKSKKSGLMRLFNKSDKNFPPPLPTSIGTATPSSSKNNREGGRTSIWSSSSTSNNDNYGNIVAESNIWPSLSKSSSTSRKNPHNQIANDMNSNAVETEEVSSQAKLSVSSIKPKLELRPVSMTFSRGLPVDYLVSASTNSHANNNDKENNNINELDQIEESSSNSSSNTIPPLPSTPTSILKNKNIQNGSNSINVNPTTLTAELSNKRLKEQLMNSKKIHKLQLFELEAQIRELKDEINELREIKRNPLGNCDKCGCTCNNIGNNNSNNMLNVIDANINGQSRRVIDRARVKTAGARGVFGSGSLYEWE
ncbi:uncharacterized protein L201_004968 [Kwoniella dendrophila CBS 6074]|uniref:Uncharacterized protein n=1 Tax=Kwoniella dendrophila CBS 6074 TaxID=1295534 RepID=A0AAX4JYT9_9TREE